MPIPVHSRQDLASWIRHHYNRVEKLIDKIIYKIYNNVDPPTLNFKCLNLLWQLNTLYNNSFSEIGNVKLWLRLDHQMGVLSHGLVHSCTIFLCRLDGEIYISDDPYRYQNMNNKDHRAPQSEDLVRCYPSRTNKQTNDKQGKIELLSHWAMEGWDEQKSHRQKASANE